MSLPRDPSFIPIKNNEPVQILSNWKKGVQVTAKRLNEYVSAINRESKHVQPPIQASQKPRNRLVVRRYRYLGTDNGDFIICQPVSESDANKGKTRIAKPFLLRKTPFDGKSRVAGGETISYAYTSSSERVATNTSDETETQVIVPSYSTNDIIFAVHDIKDKTGVRVNDIDIEWLDINDDGRAWARKSE